MPSQHSIEPRQRITKQSCPNRNKPRFADPLFHDKPDNSIKTFPSQRHRVKRFPSATLVVAKLQKSDKLRAGGD
jgi:hypothetical protein